MAPTAASVRGAGPRGHWGARPGRAELVRRGADSAASPPGRDGCTFPPAATIDDHRPTRRARGHLACVPRVWPRVDELWHRTQRGPPERPTSQSISSHFPEHYQFWQGLDDSEPALCAPGRHGMRRPPWPDAPTACAERVTPTRARPAEVDRWRSRRRRDPGYQADRWDFAC